MAFNETRPYKHGKTNMIESGVGWSAYHADTIEVARAMPDESLAGEVVHAKGHAS